MSNVLKKKKRKRSFFCLTVCFKGSAVSDPDAVPPAAGSSKSKSSTWSSWPSRFRNKRKTTGTPAVENPPPRRIGGTTSHAHDDELERTPAIKTNAGTEVKTPPKKSNSSSDLNLPVISSRYNARREPTALAINSDRVQTGSTTSQPKTSKQAGRPSSSVDSGSNAISSMLGLWVMVTTFAMMVLAGRVMAMIWFCSSLYLLRHRQRHRPTTTNVDSGKSRDLDVDSSEHKKKVVLEGLLERNGKRPSLVGLSGVRGRVYHGKS